MGLVKFKSLTAAAYAALSTKDDNTLYFTSDTHKLYKGSNEFSGTPDEDTMVLKGTIAVTTDNRGSVSIPSGYKKGYAYNVTASDGVTGTFGSYTIAAGDIAVATSDMSGAASASDFLVFKNANNIGPVWE